MASEGLHEPIEKLSAVTIDRHRAIVSLMEELEAIDWYQQRIDATDDVALAAVLGHNRDEEKEHAAMALEWLRRGAPVLDRQLRAHLFTDGPIEVEVDAPGQGAGGHDGSSVAPRRGALEVGSLRGR